MKTGKHVIFLGAGASKSSGYPLANELRLRISSRQHFDEEIKKYEEAHGLKNQEISIHADCYFKRFHEPLDLFRHGGFATLDEFCKLATSGLKFQKEINALRCFVRSALGLWNPEENFERSEYYGFVQSLFEPDLVSLRQDVTILTYNYDPYLEYLLTRALDCRWKVTACEDYDSMLSARNAVTSGFYMPEKENWLTLDKDKPSFCVLKLHGAICRVEGELNQPVNYQTLFRSSAKERGQKLFHPAATNLVPPILFPWEVMSEEGFIEKNAFPLKIDEFTYPLFRGIWERARREVQSASKISFVGLSMHHFMLDGWKYLFEGKTGTTEIVIANPENTIFVKDRKETHWGRNPHSPASILSGALSKVAPTMKKIGDSSGLQRASEGDITLVKDFSAFIRTQMKPVSRNI